MDNPKSTITILVISCRTSGHICPLILRIFPKARSVNKPKKNAPNNTQPISITQLSTLALPNPTLLCAVAVKPQFV